MFTRTSGLDVIWCPPAPFLQCKPHLTPGGAGVLAEDVDGWLVFPVVCLPQLIGEMFADVVRGKELLLVVLTVGLERNKGSFCGLVWWACAYSFQV